MAVKKVDFPIGIHPNKERIEPKSQEALKPSSRALLYYLGRYSRHNQNEEWHYCYINALPEEGRTQAEIGALLGYSRATINAAFKELTDKGYIQKFPDHYRLYNNKTIWRSIPLCKIDAALHYVGNHNGETFLLDTYALLMWAYKGEWSRPLCVTQILQFFGYSQIKSNYARVIDALDHLVSNNYCIIESHKVKNHNEGLSSYWVYSIVNPLNNDTPTYVERLNRGEEFTEEELHERRQFVENAIIEA